MKPPATSRARSEGGEKEEPNEPPLPSPYSVTSDDPDYVRINGGLELLRLLESIIKEPFYHYNSAISRYGFLVKPVHKVYKRRRGRRVVYVYYGRYWYKRMGGRLSYAGRSKPLVIDIDPPRNPLDGVTIIIDGDDILVGREGFDLFAKIARDVLEEALDGGEGQPVSNGDSKPS